MCDPLSLALVFASSAVSGVAAAQQAQAQKNQARYQGQVSANNAVIAGQNEADIIQRGSIATERARTRINQTIGTARSTLASRGLVLNEMGTSSALLQDDLALAGTSDILTMKSNIEREARRAKIEGSNFRAQEGLFKLQASSISPLFSAIVGGMGGFQSAGGMNLFGAKSAGGTDLIG